MLWDRGEANGYAHHLTDDPYPGTPAHTVLLIEAFGDHQVANIATETEARTIGAHVRQPGLAPGRSPDVVPFWDLPAVPSSPFDGSVLEMWDFGTPAPPIESTPPRLGSDPHGAARNVPERAGAGLAVPADERGVRRRVRTGPLSGLKPGWPARNPTSAGGV